MIGDVVRSLVGSWGLKLAAAFLESVGLLSRRASVGAVADRLSVDDVDGAVAALGVSPVVFRPLGVAVAAAFEAGGDAAADRVPHDASVVRFMFDARDEQAESWLLRHSTDLVSGLVDSQKIAARQFMSAGMAAGINPRTVALDLVGRVDRSTGQRTGGVLGLTPSQEAWAREYEAELQRNSTSALGRQLRDRRFDSRLKAALTSGVPLDADTRARMVRSYRNRALKYRGDSIGRTQATTALHKSQDLSFRQAVDSGHVRASDVRKVWRDSSDERVRLTHRHLDGQVVGLDEHFVSTSGAKLMFPGDPSAPASEVVECRCACEYRVDFLANVS